MNKEKEIKIFDGTDWQVLKKNAPYAEFGTSSGIRFPTKDGILHIKPGQKIRLPIDSADQPNYPVLVVFPK